MLGICDAVGHGPGELLLRHYVHSDCLLLLVVMMIMLLEVLLVAVRREMTLRWRGRWRLPLCIAVAVVVAVWIDSGKTHSEHFKISSPHTLGGMDILDGMAQSWGGLGKPCPHVNHSPPPLD